MKILYMQVIFGLIQDNTIKGSRKWQISQTDNRTSKARNGSVTNAGWLSRDAVIQLYVHQLRKKINPVEIV